MQFEELAEELFQKLSSPKNGMLQKKMSQSMQGGEFILHYLVDKDECGVVPGDISNEMGISSARTAVALNNLERKGFLTRQIDTKDRRRILIELTAEGREQAMKNKQMFIQDMARMFAFLGEYDAKEYIRITGKLVEMNGRE